MKKPLLALATVLAVVSAVEAKDWDSIRVGVDAPYPPFEYKAPDGTLTGFEIELGDKVCMEVSGKPCEWIIQAWDGIIPGLLARKYDMIFSSMSISEERKKRVLFSPAYYTTPSAFFSSTMFDPDNSTGKRVGVQRATVQDNYVTEFVTDAEVVRYTTADDMIVDIKGGRLDAMFIDAPVGMEMLGEGSDVIQVGELKKDPIRIFGEGAGAAFRKRDVDLQQAVAKALDKLKNDGTYDEIMYRYFSYSIKM